MNAQEATNLFREYQVLRATNYPSPIEVNRFPDLQRDHVEKWFSTNLTAFWIVFEGPDRGLMFRDTCSMNFDTNGIIIGYRWEQMH